MVAWAYVAHGNEDGHPAPDRCEQDEVVPACVLAQTWDDQEVPQDDGVYPWHEMQTWANLMESTSSVTLPVALIEVSAFLLGFLP